MTPPMHTIQSYPNQPQAYPPPAYPTPGYGGYQQLFAASPARLLPGPGLVAAVLGAGLSAAGLLGVPWASGVTFLDLFKANRHKPQPSDATAAFVHNFVCGGGFGIALISTVLAALWCCGVIGRRLTRRSNPTGGTVPGLMRLRVILSSLQALFLGTQFYAVWKLYDGTFESAKSGPWLLIAGATLLFVAALIGPMVRRSGPRSY